MTRASSVGVSGVAFASDGAGPVTVTVNSVAAPVAADGSFGGSVVLSEWGNAIVVLAEDALGQVSAVYLNVEQDLLPPSVWFFGAEEGQVLNLDQLTPNCGASDEFIASAQATVNGLPFTCGDTIFGFGTYAFVMDAVDQAGNSAHLSVSFALAMPPQLVVTAPADGLITNVQSFPVAGIATASPGAGPVTVSINGAGVSVAADGSFTGTASLQEGWQLVDVQATDAFGQTTTLIPQVVLDTVPPDVYFQIEDGWVTTDSFVPICGGSDSNLVSLQATLDGEPFTCGDMVSAEGPHTLSVAATDAAGNHSEVMNTFAIDRTPPQISVSGVADGVTVVAPVSVQVTSADAHPLDTTVILDGVVVGEAFTITQSGPHILRVDSTDLVFNCAVVELHFTVDPEDLAATIVSPADGTTTSDPIAEIVVAINAGHPISQATANGVQLALQPDGLYHANVSLVEGINEVQVVVVDSTCAQVMRAVTVVLSSGATALVAQIASSATAGQPLSLVIRALDQLGNLATSYRGSVHLTSTDSQALLPGDYTFTATDAGEHSFVNGIAFRTAGAQTLSATDGTLSASQAGIAVSAGAAAQLILSGIPSPIAAGATTSFNLEVTDSFANPATSYTGTVSFSSSDPRAVIPAPYTFTASDAGAHVFTGALAFLTAGLQSLTATDGAISGSRTGISVADSVPPDPQLVAPPVDTTVPTALASSTAFLYTGANPIQTGVAPGTIDSKRVVVLRGTVHDRSGAPLPAAVAKVLNHPEFGQTLSRADGAYDLAVNGGSALVVVLDKPGFLEAQRQVATQWQEYEQVPEAVLVPLDPASTLLDFTNTTLTQVLRGTPTVDDMGERQATVFIPPGTQATLVFEDGSTQPASALHIRATEYTIGASGQKAMPAALPPTSAYTYAVEFTADEAAGAKTIQFSQHVYGYVENFLSFRVGAVVPNGYYDRDLGQWVPQENGRVVQIVSVTGDLADVDSDGDGVADDAAKLAALDLSNSERERLAATYAIGQTLWRMPMTHFTPVDFNGNPVLGPFPGPGPTTPAPQRDLAPGTQCKVGGSIIECQSQTLGEEVPLAGTPYALTYRSSRQLGRRSNYRLNITVPHAITVVPPPAPVVCVAGRTPRCSSTPSGAIPVPVHVYISVAGQVSVQSSTNPSEPDRIYAYEWDGKDAYGRTLQGEQPIDVRWCYAYPMIGYRTSSAFGRAFAAATGDGSILAMRISDGNLNMENCRTWRGKIGGLDDRARGLGGWSLDVQHVYDGRNRTLYRGDGERASATDVNRFVVNRVAGKGVGQTIFCGNFFNGASALTLPVGFARGMAVSADGTIYFSGCGGQTWRINSDNTLTLVATTSATNGFASLAFAADGTLWLLDTGQGAAGATALWRLTRTGQLTRMLTLSGVGVSRGYNSEVAVGPDGSIYLSDMGRHCVRKMDADGVVQVVAGIDGVSGFSGDGGPAAQAHLSWPSGLAFGPDGTLYVADTLNSRVRAVRPDGTIRTVLGPVDPIGNDVVAPHKLAATRDGTLFVGVSLGIQKITPDGDVVSVVTDGTGTQCGGLADCPAERFGRLIAESIAIAPDGSLVAADGSIIRRIDSGFARSTTASEVFVGSRDASEVYVFDASGRHLRTLDALTTAVTQRFAYDAAGRLASVTDRAGNVTTIQRDGQGNPIAIVGPFGQTTALTLDGNGYLASITNPNGELFSMVYQQPSAGDGHGAGLLTRLTDPRLGVHTMQYDPDGFLTNDTRPDGSSETLSRGGSLGATNVTRSTALGRITRYNVSWNPTTGAETSSIAAPDGSSSTTVTKADHSLSASYPDGMSVTTTTTPDPRFGMDAFAVSSTTKTPAGLTRTVSTSRSATLASASDPLTLSSLLESVSVNGRNSQISYNGSTRRMTLTSAAGRVTTMDYDALGRVTQIAPPGVQPLVLHYDARGRNDSITQGTRVTSMSYRADGFLASILDPLQRTTSFDYDLAGRPVATTLPDLSVIGTSHDPSGNVTSVTPPGRPAHAFNYTPADLESDYTPPGGPSFNTHTSYNLDQQVSQVSRPDGDFITPTYDAAKGRLTAFTTSRGTNTYGYSPTTGQLTSINTFDGVGLNYSYDGSLLKSVTSSGPVSGTVNKTYDSSFRLSSESVTGGQTINFGYDNDDLLTSAGAMTITRDPATGFVTGTTLGAISESRTYDAFGAEQTYTVTANSTTLYSVNYGTRDALGRIVNKTETIQGTTHVYGYTYDANGRLIDVTTDGSAISHYEYDANGNRLVGPGLTASPAYDNQDRLLSYGNCTYTYKNDGSLQTKACPDGTTTYDYDAFGNLRGVTLPNGTAITYVIDGQNRRVGKKVNGALVEAFVYEDQLKRVGWYDTTGTQKAQFIFGARSQVPDYMTKAGAAYRLVYDQIGSVRLVVDPNGAVAERVDYDEFGNVLADTAPGFQPFGFAGGLRDFDTTLTRFGARDYDPSSGRWTAKDPLRFGGGDTDLYGYSGVEPINRFDPSGLLPRSRLPWQARDCKPPERAKCEAQCAGRGVESCKVNQTWRLTRQISDGKTLTSYGWVDGPMSCSCNDDQPPPSPACSQNCAKVLMWVAAAGTFVWACLQAVPAIP